MSHLKLVRSQNVVNEEEGLATVELPRPPQPGRHLCVTSGSNLNQYLPYWGLGSQKLLVNDFGFSRCDEKLLMTNHLIVRILFPQNENGLQRPLMCIAGLSKHASLLKTLSTFIVGVSWFNSKYDQNTCELWNPAARMDVNYVHEQVIERVGEHSDMVYSAARWFSQLSTMSYNGHVEAADVGFRPMLGFWKFDAIELYSRAMRARRVTCSPLQLSVETEVGTGISRVYYAVPVSDLRNLVRQY